MERSALLVAACVIGSFLSSGCATSASSHGSTTAPTGNGAGFYFDQDAIPDAKPWSSENFRNDPQDFQFAIIGDRTGGANVEGTFAQAMTKLNLLQPEFVINVGDLIEGYSDDKAELNEMWADAEGFTGKLQMPFFYTIGNHDVDNPIGKEVWLERHGADYYYFLYRNVLFLVLNSEDGSRPEPPPHMKESIDLYNRLQVEDPEAAQKMLAEFMSDEAVIAGLSKPVEFPAAQLTWIKRTLKEHANVRWTFVFSHEPVWENPSASFKEVQKFLQDRNFTWFAGHLHYYDYDLIDGHEYITMGPAGASFHHEGPGNVDHVTWITMTDQGPEIANIALKGLFDRKGLDPDMFGAYDRKGHDTPNPQ